MEQLAHAAISGGSSAIPYVPPAARPAMPPGRTHDDIAASAAGLDANALLTLLIGCNLLLVALHVLFTRIIISVPTLTAWFNLDAEVNVPTWFSSTQLFLCSLLFWVNGTRFREQFRHLGTSYRLLGAAFLYLSLDEGAAIHERLGSFVREAWPGAPALPFGNSVLGYLVAALIATVLFRKPVRAFLSETRLTSRLVFGGVVWATGAVGVELIGLQLKRHGYDGSGLMRAEVVIEESLEMLGESLILSALFRKLRSPLSSAGEGGRRRE